VFEEGEFGAERHLCLLEKVQCPVSPKSEFWNPASVKTVNKDSMNSSSTYDRQIVIDKEKAEFVREGLQRFTGSEGPKYLPLNFPSFPVNATKVYTHWALSSVVAKRTEKLSRVWELAAKEKKRSEKVAQWHRQHFGKDPEPSSSQAQKALDQSVSNSNPKPRNSDQIPQSSGSVPKSSDQPPSTSNQTGLMIIYTKKLELVNIIDNCQQWIFVIFRSQNTSFIYGLVYFSPQFPMETSNNLLEETLLTITQ